MLNFQETLQSDIATILNIDPGQLHQEETNISKDVQCKAKDMDRLIEQIKEKVLISNRNQKIQLLTLIPTSWSHKSIEDEFNVTNYMVRTSRILLQDKGILSFPEKKERCFR